MKQIIAIVLLISFNVNAGQCENLNWKIAVKDNHFVKYRGTVSPGTEVIYLELYNRREIIGQGRDYPSPSGAWEIMFYADYVVRNGHREHFYCN